jgi:hypothetical protein
VQLRGTGEDSGILYAATGARYLAEAATSAQSVRRTNPGLPICLVTGQADTPADSFDDVIRCDVGEDGYEVKVAAMGLSPFARTLFLDGDTYVVGDLTGAFALLDHFDIAAAHAPNRVVLELEECPHAFPEFNTGVIVFGPRVEPSGFFDTWHALYRELRPQHPASYDQPSFRKAVYTSELRVATLPPEWNCRFLMAGFISEPVAVLHGHADAAGYETVATLFNERVSPPESWVVYASGLLCTSRAGQTSTVTFARRGSGQEST